MSESKRKFAVCLTNEGYEASLEPRKIYELAPAEPKDPEGWLRVVDESGEDYLYPATRFYPIDLPADLRHALADEVAEP